MHEEDHEQCEQPLSYTTTKCTWPRLVELWTYVRVTDTVYLFGNRLTVAVLQISYNGATMDPESLLF